MPASAPAVPDGLDRIGALLDEAVGEGRIPGAVAVVGRGPVTLGRWAAGQADAIRGRPMRADTVFDLASLTKVVATTTVTLALAGRGQLGLGDPVASYLPGFAACRDGRVTVAHLLTHTSGLPGSRTFYRWCGSRAELLRDLCQTPLDAPPGSRVAYSDLGFIALGEVVAAAAGEPLDAAVRHLVTGPLGLDADRIQPERPAGLLRRHRTPRRRDRLDGHGARRERPPDGRRRPGTPGSSPRRRTWPGSRPGGSATTTPWSRRRCAAPRPPARPRLPRPPVPAAAATVGPARATASTSWAATGRRRPCRTPASPAPAWPWIRRPACGWSC